jgi:hypothetical protein
MNDNMDDSPWRGAGPELITAAITVAVTALAGIAVAGWPGLAVVAAGTAALSVVVLRGLAPRPAGQTVRKTREKQSARSIAGFAQRKFVVASGTGNRAFFESDLRPALEHLLAARLAERHGINLYTQPEAARRAFCRTNADAALWRWIDPAVERPAEQRGSTERGIPRRVLARLVERLEHL